MGPCTRTPQAHLFLDETCLDCSAAGPLHSTALTPLFMSDLWEQMAAGYWLVACCHFFNLLTVKKRTGCACAGRCVYRQCLYRSVTSTLHNIMQTLLVHADLLSNTEHLCAGALQPGQRVPAVPIEKYHEHSSEHNAHTPCACRLTEHQRTCLQAHFNLGKVYRQCL